jgi:hypothetical protein
VPAAGNRMDMPGHVNWSAPRVRFMAQVQSASGRFVDTGRSAPAGRPPRIGVAAHQHDPANMPVAPGGQRTITGARAASPSTNS